MAGELLVQPFNAGRFAELESALVALDSTRKLGEVARQTVTATLPPISGERAGGGRNVLHRILAAPDVDPRTFLTPRELDSAIDALVTLTCFEDGAAYSLVQEVGASWVVLDAVQRDLMDQPWYERVFHAEDRALVAPIRFPARGEDRRSMLTPEGTRMVVANIDAMPETWTAVPAFRDVLTALHRLARSVESRPGWTLAFQFLL